MFYCAQFSFIEIVCSVGGVAGRVTFNCVTSNDLFLPLLCSILSESGNSVNVPCKLNLHGSVLDCLPDAFTFRTHF